MAVVRSRGTLDRPVACVVFVCCAGALVMTAALARAPVPPAVESDASAARDLIALMRASEHGRYVVEYTFTRTQPSGATLPSTLAEARTARLHLLRGPTTLTIETRGRVYDCELVQPQARCAVSAAARSLADSEVLAIAVAARAYDVSRASSRLVAGRRARCFALRLAGRARALPGIGVRYEACYSADGMPLVTERVDATGVVDERRATSATTVVDDATLRPLLAGFEAATGGSGK